MDEGRRRPRLHFTPRAGRIDDLCGVVHAGGRYHLFYRGGTAGDVVLGHATSADLVLWTEHPSTPAPGPDEVDGWEQPQVFELDGVWVQIVPVPGRGVGYELGEHDGSTFAARDRGRFGWGGQMSATTTFQDTAGRRCALSWLRGPPGAGAFSLPWVLSVRAGRLLAAPHPDLDRYLIDGGADLVDGGAGPVDGGAGPSDTHGLRVENGRLLDGDDGDAVLLELPAGGEVTLIADAALVEVAVEGVSGLATARRAGSDRSGVRLLRFTAGRGGNPERHASE
ncbi:hypothetical protein ACWKSP_36175 [Micromonosporaceae bacterium Da 78-11]